MGWTGEFRLSTKLHHPQHYQNLAGFCPILEGIKILNCQVRLHSYSIAVPVNGLGSPRATQYLLTLILLLRVVC